ncbi:MAG: aldehyde dehydrogenase family protein [Schleiferiaceae bacterium]|nr:aldehyde dehydrogenase family protein [Schleiferiaceae bacterium]
MESLSPSPEAHLAEAYPTQKAYYAAGHTQPLAARKTSLQKLLSLLEKEETALLEALAADLGKPPFEGYASEVGFVKAELRLTLRKLKRWARPRRVKSPLFTWPSRSHIRPEPKGVTLLIAPWNYPLQLLLAPAVAALAAGNTAVLKPSEFTPHTARLVEKLVAANFPPGLLTVVQGPGHEVVPRLMKAHRFDHVFFTGSTAVGRSIAELAAPQLVPTTLELGGKSPAVLHESARLKVAVRRIAFGKWLNAGQTCVAPDYLLVPRAQMELITATFEAVLADFFPQGALQSPDYGKLIHDKHFARQKAYLNDGQVLLGGSCDEARRQIAPTLLGAVAPDAAVMQEEIFGPILPVIPYDDEAEALAFIRRYDPPLALYVFAEDRAVQRRFTEEVAFGGGAINTSVLHLSSPHLPFGGIAQSGMGQYHGRFGFDTFSHPKALLNNATWLDIPFKYPPYSQKALAQIKKIMG